LIDVPGDFCIRWNERDTGTRRTGLWRGKKHTAEQIIAILRQVEIAVGNGKATPRACREAGITEQTYYRWRKEYGGLTLDQARRLKELERESSSNVGASRTTRCVRTRR
jgi:transposase-like protein